MVGTSSHRHLDFEKGRQTCSVLDRADNLIIYPFFSPIQPAALPTHWLNPTGHRSQACQVDSLHRSTEVRDCKPCRGVENSGSGRQIEVLSQGIRTVK